MLGPKDDIYVTLSSNVPGVPGNKPSNDKTVVPTSPTLETQYPHQISNLKATTMVVICTENPLSDQPNPIQAQLNLKQLCSVR